MAEEHRFRAPRLCANNCGFFGSLAAQDLCPKCHRDLQMRELQASAAASSPYPAIISTPPSDLPLPVPSPTAAAAAGEVQLQRSAASAASQPNRCSTCRRRVGLTGFKCRCGLVYCGSHRYPEQHACGFDFKGYGREQIAKANPVIKASKLDKI
ncbi:hypothetical protein SAY86_003072 [Trapa natans]|uniref:Zinc finger A20 and AN1 domain-containing stress-associated protein 3 n=1 Tax=Trapa natans TaxID=22666 RepID=A0AAN7LSB0_TRANT|nr:hypothetical protein SAY86_003072 [Trapa natans]